MKQLFIYLRPFFLSLEAGRNRKGQGAGGSRADIPRLIIIFGFSKEGLRNLGKFSRGLPKLIWDLHTNFTEIKMQEIRVRHDSNPNIPNKKNSF
jgi:hypothetical protein